MTDTNVISWLERAFSADVSILGRGKLFQPPTMANPQVLGFFTSDEVFELEIRYEDIENYFKSPILFNH